MQPRVCRWPSWHVLHHFQPDMWRLKEEKAVSCTGMQPLSSISCFHLIAPTISRAAPHVPCTRFHQQGLLRQVSTGKESQVHPLDDYFRELVARRRVASAAGTVAGPTDLPGPVPVHKLDTLALLPSTALPSSSTKGKSSPRISESPTAAESELPQTSDLHTVRVSDASTATELATAIQDEVSASKRHHPSVDVSCSIDSEGVYTSGMMYVLVFCGHLPDLSPEVCSMSFCSTSFGLLENLEMLQAPQHIYPQQQHLIQKTFAAQNGKRGSLSSSVPSASAPWKRLLHSATVQMARCWCHPSMDPRMIVLSLLAFSQYLHISIIGPRHGEARGQCMGNFTHAAVLASTSWPS